MARIVISPKSVQEMDSDESEDEIFVGRLQKKELLKLHVAGKKVPTVLRNQAISSPASKYSGVEVLSDSELSEVTNSDSSVQKADTQTHEFVTGRLEQNLEEDKSKNTFYENLTSNCNVTETSVVGGRHASLQSEDVDTNTTNTNGNADTNTDSPLCGEKLMSTDGDNLMHEDILEKTTVDVQSVSSLQADISEESVEVLSDSELSEVTNSDSSVQKADTQTQEFVTGRLEQNLEEDKSKNTFYENLTKNCNVTETSVVGGRHASLQPENVDTNTMNTNRNADTNTDSSLCGEKLMSTDGDNLMPVDILENTTVDVQSVTSLQADVSESIELMSDNELSEEISSNSLVQQADTQSQEFVTKRIEQYFEEDKSKNSCYENLTKDCNITERSVVGGRHAQLQSENVDTNTMGTNGNADTNTDSLLCDEKVMSTDNSDGDNLMAVDTLEKAIVDVQSVNSLEEDVPESIELISDNELSEEVSSNSLVQQSDTQSQEFITKRIEQHLEEDKNKNSCYENLTKNCNITERSVVGGRHAQLESESVDTNTMGTNGHADTNTDSLLCDEKVMSTDNSDGCNPIPVATLENSTVDVYSVNSLQEDISESVELISDNEEFITESLENSLHKDKIENTFYENSTKNCNVTERSAVGGRHTSLELHLDTDTKRTNENADTNTDSLLCDKKLMSTDNSGGDNLMPTAAIENATVNVQSVNCLQAVISEENVELSDNELSHKSSKVSAQQSDIRLQEFVTGRHEQSMEEDKRNNTFFENLTKNCNVTDTAIVGGSNTSLQATNAVTEMVRQNGNESLMSADRPELDCQMSVAMFENAAVNDQSAKSLQADVSDSIELISDNELSERRSSNFLVHQSDTQSQDGVTERLEESFVEDKSEYIFHETCNITESFVVDGGHSSLQAENIDTETMNANGNRYTNTGSMLCDEKLPSADKSGGDSQMPIATFKNATVDVHSANSIQTDVFENVEVKSDNELLQEISSKSLVQQSGTQLHEFVTESHEQSLEEDEINSSFCENLRKDCDDIERSVVGSRHTSLQAENPDIETMKVNGNIDSMLCDEELMAAGKSDGGIQMSVATLGNATMGIQSANCFQAGVSESVSLISDNELLAERSSDSLDHQSNTQSQEFLTGRLEQSLEKDKNKNLSSENLMNTCNIIERSSVGGRNTPFRAKNVDTETLMQGRNTDKNMGGMLCDEKLTSTGRSDGDNQISIVTSDIAVVDVPSDNCLHPDVSESPELINNEDLLTEASVACAKNSLLQIGTVNITTTKTDGVDDMIITSTDRLDSVDQITAEVCENLAINLDSPAFHHTKASEGDCGNAHTDSECLFRSEVSAIVKDINELEKYERLYCQTPSCDSSISETCVSGTRTSSRISGSTYYPKEGSSSSDEDIHENTFEMMEKLLNGFEMKPDYACEEERDSARVNEVNMSHAHKEEVDGVHTHEDKAGGTSVHKDEAGTTFVCEENASSVSACKVEAAGEPAYAHGHKVESDCVDNCKTEADYVRTCEAQQDCAGTPDMEEDCTRASDTGVCAHDTGLGPVHTHDDGLDRVPACGTGPDRAPARDAGPDRAPARDAGPDRAPARDAGPDRAPARDAGPDRVVGLGAELDCQPVFVEKTGSLLEVKLKSADNSDIKTEVKSVKNILRESNSGRTSLKRASSNILYPARCSKTPKREGSTQKMTKNHILPQSPGPIRKGRLHAVKSSVKEYLNSTQPPLFANVRNRNGYGMHQKALLSPVNAKKTPQDCSTPSKTKKIILPPVSYTSSSAAKLDVSKSTSANYVAEKCKKKIVPRSSPTVIKHAGRTILPAKQWKQNGESEGEVSVLLTSEAVRSNTLKKTRKKH